LGGKRGGENRGNTPGGLCPKTGVKGYPVKTGRKRPFLKEGATKRGGFPDKEEGVCKETL